MFRNKLNDFFVKYGSNDFDLFFKKYLELKLDYSIKDRWRDYTLIIDYCLELEQFSYAISEWNSLTEEEWEGWNTKWSYHEFHLPYLLKFEFLTKKAVVTGHNVFRMSGWKNLTKFGIGKADLIKESIDELIKEKGSFFNFIWGDYNFEINYTNSKQLKRDAGMNLNIFYENCYNKAEDLARMGENYFRKNSGLPKIGEGWISETNLYYEIKEALTCEVIQHGKPKWLGRQHFDIWIPSLNVAIEYQGLQHDKPIDFFGGEKSFLDNQKRDLKKKKLCFENNVKLIEVRKNYKIAEIIQKIHNQ